MCHWWIQNNCFLTLIRVILKIMIVIKLFMTAGSYTSKTIKLESERERLCISRPSLQQLHPKNSSINIQFHECVFSATCSGGGRNSSTLWETLDWGNFSWEFPIDYSLAVSHGSFRRQRKRTTRDGGTDPELISTVRLLHKLCTCPLSRRRHYHPSSPSLGFLSDNKTGPPEIKEFSKFIFLLGQLTHLYLFMGFAPSLPMGLWNFVGVWTNTWSSQAYKSLR